MKILHVASFDGNIGDNASHIGFNNLISSILNPGFTIDRLEIRKFYNNYSLSDKRYFDKDFAYLANKYDLLIIGGGGFLDFDIANSITGTTLNISNQILDLIKTPIFISSIGSNPRNEIPENNIGKFKDFLNCFLGREKSFLAVRNDGSMKAIRNHIGNDFANAISQVLDHAFFYSNDGSHYRPTSKPYILINTTSDQLRMSNIADVKKDVNLYIQEMVKVINYILEETDMNIVFAPHIYSDIGAISDLLKHINDYYIRTRINITPYAQSDEGCNQVFSAYKNSNLILGMRFHANVCSMALDKPCLGISALDRVSKVFEDMNLLDQVFTIERPFGDDLIRKIKRLDSGDYLTVDRSNLISRKKEMLILYRNKFSEIL